MSFFDRFFLLRSVAIPNGYKLLYQIVVVAGVGYVVFHFIHKWW